MDFISTWKSSVPALLVQLFRLLEDRVPFDYNCFVPINTKDLVRFCKE